ncbi:glycosyltransferase [Aeromonas veronii]|uniref:glycosyltransferase n=1 Tax=Aeromonas veronii TaxID=654 RepID=UPI00300603D9
MKIVFIGTTNAMPMSYAIKFKERGYDVKYIVDVPPVDSLSRPECHYENISYPYPNWIKEIVISNPSIKCLYPKIFYKKIYNEVLDGDVFFLCDWYISLAPYLPKNSKIIILPHGADLDTWCNFKKADDIAAVGRLSFFKSLKKILAKLIINRMYKGLCCADVITYYPRGFNSEGDNIIDGVRKIKDCALVTRYDVNLNVLNGFGNSYRVNPSRLKICVAVRFDFKSTQGVENKYLKGSDLIIKGISKYYREFSKNIEVIFFEKGKDIELAKKLCREEGIDSIVKWVNAVPLRQLLEQMENSDICFDQVGGHWMGAIGVYAMYLGKPVITNYRPEILNDFLKGTIPMCQATTVNEIFDKLVFLSNESNRENVSQNGREFVINNFSCDSVFNEYVKLLDLHINN